MNSWQKLTKRYQIILLNVLLATNLSVRNVTKNGSKLVLFRFMVMSLRNT